MGSAGAAGAEAGAGVRRARLAGAAAERGEQVPGLGLAVLGVLAGWLPFPGRRWAPAGQGGRPSRGRR